MRARLTVEHSCTLRYRHVLNPNSPLGGCQPDPIIISNSYASSCFDMRYSDTAISMLAPLDAADLLNHAMNKRYKAADESSRCD